MKKLFIIIGFFLLPFYFAAAGRAQTTPPMTSARMDNDKEALYARFTSFKRSPNPEQQRFAYPTAKEYLMRFGGERDAETKEVIRWVAEYEREMHARDLYAAYSAKDHQKLFDLARPLVKNDPEYFLAFALMTDAAFEKAMSGNLEFTAEAAGYARKAIQLLDEGKTSKPEPFKSLETARGFLNFALGTFVREQNPVEAAAAFTRAVKADSPYRTDPAAYHRLGVSILKGEFAQLSTEYNLKFGGQSPSAAQSAMLKRLKQLAEQTIDAYARAVALSTKPEQQDARARILAQLTALYKNFHNNSDAGLNELIATVLTKPMP
jgi:hypothetical protein